MRWLTQTAVKPTDTISGLQFGPQNQLACTSWNGSVYVISENALNKEQSPSSENWSSPKAPKDWEEVQYSRPLFALAWQHKVPILWYGGGEERICSLDLEHSVAKDRIDCQEPVLALCMGSDDNLLVGSTPSRLLQADPRSPNINYFGKELGTQAMDMQGGSLAISVRGQAQVFDLRNLSRPVSVQEMMKSTNSLQLKWISPDTYAVSDTESHVHIHSKSMDSYVFNSNRVNSMTRPIYALASNPANQNTVATGGGDRHVYVWDCKNRAMSTRITFPLACTSIAYSFDGTQMAVGLSSDDWSTTDAKYNSPSKARIMTCSLSS